MEITTWKKQESEWGYYKDWFFVRKCIVLVKLFTDEIFYIINRKHLFKNIFLINEVNGSLTDKILKKGIIKEKLHKKVLYVHFLLLYADGQLTQNSKKTSKKTFYFILLNVLFLFKLLRKQLKKTERPLCSEKTQSQGTSIFDCSLYG